MTKSNYSIFDKMIEGVQVINRDWQYTYVNDAVTAQGKSTREEMQGRTMMEKYPSIERTEVFKYISMCMRERVACQMVNEFQFPDGSWGWFDLRMEPVEEGVLIMSFDITRQKQLEVELRRLNEELENRVEERTKELLESLGRERELNEMKSAFVSMASHEFRTPLAAILSSASLAERYTEPDRADRRQMHFKKIKATVTHLTSILNDFLSLNKLESGKAEYNPSTIALRDYIEELLDDLRLLCKDGQKICYVHKGDKDSVQLDKHVMQHIVYNIVSNAIKYSPNGEDVEFMTELKDDTLIIRVTDRGIGIPDQDQEKMFDKFFRASNAYSIQGTGLGLNIVKKYLDLTGGEISFSSKVNEGTTFEVTIPHRVAEKHNG